MKVIIGLGNVGKEYEKTRHNTGYIIIDKLIQKYALDNKKKKNNYIAYEGTINEEKVAIIKPTTFMNLSSKAVLESINWYKIELKNLLVIYDDIDIDLGDIRYREKGSAGTHNGMRDIINNLKRNDIKRIRVGIGKSLNPNILLSDYVLSNFTKQEWDKLNSDIFSNIEEKVDIFLTSNK